MTQDDRDTLTFWLVCMKLASWFGGTVITLHFALKFW